jgi:hypothetical protein
MFCKKVFKKGCALGGHISKKHKNQSSVYKAKIERRDQRKEERDILEKAK